MNNREKGSAYEDEAASFFEKQHYEIRERNYGRKTGEIDLILLAPDKETLVFAEIKYRKTARNGQPFEAVTRSKQAHIYRTAQWYLAEKGIPADTPCRFDVLSILNGKITHFENAFGGF